MKFYLNFTFFIKFFDYFRWLSCGKAICFNCFGKYSLFRKYLNITILFLPILIIRVPKN